MADDISRATEPDPDCERCDGSGLDPDAYFVKGDIWTHAPFPECFPDEDSIEGPERVKHSGPETKFCVLCLSGEHERVDEAPQPFTPPVHYRRDDGVGCCVHTVPVGPNSCPACRDLVDEAAPPLPSVIRLGTQWCWDPLYPHLLCRVRIVDTRWDGVLWWVKTEALSASRDRRAGDQRLHTLDRFIESTVAVDDV